MWIVARNGCCLSFLTGSFALSLASLSPHEDADDFSCNIPTYFALLMELCPSGQRGVCCLLGERQGRKGEDSRDSGPERRSLRLLERQHH